MASARRVRGSLSPISLLFTPKFSINGNIASSSGSISASDAGRQSELPARSCPTLADKCSRQSSLIAKAC